RLHYHPDFVLSLPAAELGGVLLHEVHHIVLGHLAINPADYPDSWALTVALEVSANEFIREPLPPGGIHLQQVPSLPPMESVIDRYHRLRHEQNRFPIDGVALASGGRLSMPSVSAGDPGEAALVLDNHALWEDGLKDPKVTLQTVAAAVQQAALE